MSYTKKHAFTIHNAYKKDPDYQRNKKKSSLAPDTQSAPRLTSETRSASTSNKNITGNKKTGKQNTQEEQSRKQVALSDVGMTEQNGKAAWLLERIDRLMHEYGASVER